MTMTTFERRRVENLNPGDASEDGTLFAGISPDTGKPFFAADDDESAPMTWDDAKKAANLRSTRDVRWRLPTDNEHAVMRRISGLFNDAGWYWSAHEVNRRKARTWNAGEGACNDDFKFRPSLVRLVRD